MSESAAGKSNPRIEALVKDVEVLRKELEELFDWRPGIERGVQTALKESREAVRLAGRNDLLNGAPRPTEGSSSDGWPLPWRIANPRGTRLLLSARGRDDMKILEKDGSLREEFLKKLRAVLEYPDSYGKPMSGVRKGQRSVRVADNYRLVWTVVGDAARLELFCRKEDRRYSPFGAP